MTAARNRPAAKTGSTPTVRRPRAAASKLPKAAAPALPATLLLELRQLIDASRRAAAVTANMAQSQLYWQVGRRIHAEVLGARRAAYGEEIVATLSRQLVAEYGRGFEEKNLRRMVQFAEAFPDETIVATLWRQLSWSHFRELLPLKRPLQREFYGTNTNARPTSCRRWASSCAPTRTTSRWS